MLPLRLFLRCGTASRVQLKCPVMSTARQRSHSAGSISSTRPVGPATPALLTRQSSPPSAASASSKSFALAPIGPVGLRARDLRVVLGERSERAVVDVADMDLGALAQEGA